MSENEYLLWETEMSRRFYVAFSRPTSDSSSAYRYVIHKSLSVAHKRPGCAIMNFMHSITWDYARRGSACQPRAASSCQAARIPRFEADRPRM